MLDNFSWLDGRHVGDVASQATEYPKLNPLSGKGTCMKEFGWGFSPNHGLSGKC